MAASYSHLSLLSKPSSSSPPPLCFSLSSLSPSKTLKPSHPSKISPKPHSVFVTNTPSYPSTTTTTTTKAFPPKANFFETDPFELRKGADVLAEALARAGVDVVFSSMGSAPVEIYRALIRSNTSIEEGGTFAAMGYARASGSPGVCIANSGPGAANLVSGLTDAFFNGIPLVAITSHVPYCRIGTDAFQELPAVAVTRSITKHHYLVLNAEDIPLIVKEAFFLATSGRPGPVIIDIPIGVQQKPIIPYLDRPMKLDEYLSHLPKLAKAPELEQVLRLVDESKKPVLYIGGGCLNLSAELHQFVELTGIPVTSTLMGLGVYPSSGELSLGMLGLHVDENYVVDNADLLVAVGVHSNDQLTGKLEAFSSRAKIVHIDINPADIGKNQQQPHVSIVANLNSVFKDLNSMLEQRKAAGKLNPDFSAWREELKKQKLEFPLSLNSFEDDILPQYVIQVLNELTDSDAIITTGVGQHQMWTAQYYDFKRPGQCVTSSGIGAMGFGLPAAIGAAKASPGSTVVNIDGDGSFIMGIRELATLKINQLDVKILILNNQNLDMVLQWEDRIYRANEVRTYVGIIDDEYEAFPNFLKLAKAFNIPAARVTEKSELRGAIHKMLETSGPYLLDVVIEPQYFLDDVIEPQYFSDDVIEPH